MNLLTVPAQAITTPLRNISLSMQSLNTSVPSNVKVRLIFGMRRQRKSSHPSARFRKSACSATTRTKSKRPFPSCKKSLKKKRIVEVENLIWNHDPWPSRLVEPLENSSSMKHDVVVVEPKDSELNEIPPWGYSCQTNNACHHRFRSLAIAFDLFHNHSWSANAENDTCRTRNVLGRLPMRDARRTLTPNRANSRATVPSHSKAFIHQ